MSRDRSVSREKMRVGKECEYRRRERREENARRDGMRVEKECD